MTTITLPAAPLAGTSITIMADGSGQWIKVSGNMNLPNKIKSQMKKEEKQRLQKANEFAEKVLSGEYEDWREFYTNEQLAAIVDMLAKENADLRNRVSSLEAKLCEEPTPGLIRNTKQLLKRA